MSFNYSKARNGGLFLLVDGIADDPACVEAKQQLPTRLADFASLATINMQLRSRWARWMGDGINLFQAGRGRVLIFPAKDVA
jgi:hypothetical protein